MKLLIALDWRSSLFHPVPRLLKPSTSRTEPTTSAQTHLSFCLLLLEESHPRPLGHRGHPQRQHHLSAEYYLPSLPKETRSLVNSRFWKSLESTLFSLNPLTFLQLKASLFIYGLFILPSNQHPRLCFPAHPSSCCQSDPSNLHIGPNHFKILITEFFSRQSCILST